MTKLDKLQKMYGDKIYSGSDEEGYDEIEYRLLFKEIINNKVFLQIITKNIYGFREYMVRIERKWKFIETYFNVSLNFEYSFIPDPYQQKTEQVFEKYRTLRNCSLIDFL